VKSLVKDDLSDQWYFILLILLSVINGWGQDSAPSKGSNTERGWIGIRFKDAVAPSRGGGRAVSDGGTLITGVSAKSPAGQSVQGGDLGLRAGDVLLTFNGKAVEGKAHLESLLASTWPSQKIELEYLRQNSKECLLITLGELDQTAASEERLLDFLDASNINIGMVSKIPTPLSSATVNSARSNPQKSSNLSYQQDQATNAMHFWIGFVAIIGISGWWHLGRKKRQQLRRSAVTYLRQEMRNLVSLGASRIDLAQFLEQMGLQVDGNFYQISQVTGVANVPVPTHNRPVLISAELTSALLAEVENRLQRLETEAEQALHDHFMALVSTSETVTGLIQQVVVNPDQFQMQEEQFTEPVTVTLPGLEVPSVTISAETVNQALSTAKNATQQKAT